MRHVRHWIIWLTPPWGRNARRRAVLEQVKRWQAEERRLAFGRIENYSKARTFGPPRWAEPTRAYPTTRPLLTPGQQARSGGEES